MLLILTKAGWIKQTGNLEHGEKEKEGELVT